MSAHLPQSILLVDDDSDAGNIFDLVLGFHGVETTILQNGEEAIRHLGEKHYDIVILDLFLPGIDGYKTLERIRTAGLDQMAKFVATTAYYTRDTVHEVMDRGFDAYLEKPFAADNLLNSLVEIYNT